MVKGIEIWNKIKQKSGIELTMTISGLILLLISTLAITGWITGMNVLSSIYLNYIPMAASTALFFMVFGVLLVFNLFETKQKKIRTFIVSFSIFITVYGSLKILDYFIHKDLTLDQLIISESRKLGNIPLNKMSNYGGLLFCLSGIAVLIKYFGKEKQIIANIVGIIGIIVSFAGFVASLGYSFGTPFLYSGKLIPMAFTSALSFLFLGFGLLSLAGKQNFIVRKLIGTQASARILRTFIPFLIFENVIGDIMELYISRVYHINEAMISALVALISIIIAIVLTLYLTRIIFKNADLAEVDRKKAEEALKESLELRNTLLKTIPFGMDIIDEEGIILFQNESFKKILGRNVIGSKCWEAYRDDHKQCTECPIKEGIKIGDTKSIESYGVLGGKIFEIIHTGLMFDGKKAILEIFHDITERKQSEIQLKDYAEELELANNTKDKLFSIVAHDLRSPFNSILGLTSFLNDQFDTFSDDEKKTTVTKLKESSESAFNLLENLLAWSFAQRQGITVKSEKIDLHEIVDLQMNVFENIALSKNMQIVNLISPGTFANADSNTVTTIIRNLINNAIKFSYSGGSVTLSSFKKKDKIGISVTDRGVGIATHHLENIFSLSKTHSTKGTENEKGTGLGLIVCKEFVELNKGEIWVESELGKGSKFSFTLPTEVKTKKGVLSV